MAPRFFSSPYKNAVATTAKKEFWWAELPVSTNAASESADLIKCSSEYWLAQGSAAGHLICLPYETPGKFNSRPQTLQVSGKAVTDFDVSPFDDLVAAGADDGRISVHTLPSLSSFTPSEALTPSPLATLSHPSGRGIDTLSFHSTTSSLLLAASKSTVAIFDVSRPEPIFTIEQPSAIWSAKWSADGRAVSLTTKDGFLRLFDVRVNSSAPSMETATHQGQKCSRHLWLGQDQIFTTGFSKMREREYALLDGRNLGQGPIKSQRVDTGTAAFVPVADVERGIVYFAGKGDMTMRWTEIGGHATFTDGGTPVGIMIAGVALAPPSTLNLMKAEINRLVVLTTDAVVPIPIEVPRRQYVDFHQDLFPPVRARASPPAAAGATFNAGWSRKTLIGKTALKPDYHDVHGLSASMGADTQMLKANHLHFFFPLAGAGGRLGVHPLAAKGRLPTLIPSLVCGAGIVDFELDPFDPLRVFVASDDSKIRVFVLPKEGLEADFGETVMTLSDGKMDRIGELKHHPTAKDLLLSVSDDHGHPTLRLWDLTTGSILKKVEVPAKGISSIAWSPDGNLLAVATKSKTLLILDPRSSLPPLSTSSHDSIRPVRLAWVSPTHLISTGFSRSATREFILYATSPSSITKLGTQPLDVSPAPLFPFADLDTNIVLLYSRGERSCHAFEVQPLAESKNIFSRLPSFEHGTLQAGFAFLPKAGNDVRSVEIIKALRLTPATVETVAFSVPRARVEYFQDDIFVPTRDVETPALSAQEWIEGKDAKLRMLDLRPEGLKLLSEAPITAAKASTRSKITGPVVTESQKQEQYLEKLFQAAQVEDDDDEVGRKTQVGMAAPEDDDW
ncbi:hypothetical protein RQP46_003379 [Phenoliferia psychrophenolica]